MIKLLYKPAGMLVSVLGGYPLPVEVIPMARSHVAHLPRLKRPDEVPVERVGHAVVLRDQVLRAVAAVGERLGLDATAAAYSLSSQVLWGNVASALAGGVLAQLRALLLGPLSSPEEQGMSSERLARLVEFGTRNDMDSLLVTRHGRIVLEGSGEALGAALADALATGAALAAHPRDASLWEAAFRILNGAERFDEALRVFVFLTLTRIWPGSSVGRNCPPAARSESRSNP